nr:DUF4352 domain-containing protein [Armatimonas sp.]
MKSSWLIFSVVSLSAISLPAAPLAQTKPLTGTIGVIGTPSRIGKYQIILTGASFATRVNSNDMAVAGQGKKFLVLNYTVQNPGTQELGFDGSLVRFTVVGADNANYENVEVALNPEKMSQVSVQLKPAQKAPFVTYVEVPASDPIPKLIVLSGNAPVIRFDLKGKVKKFTGMYAAPDGVTALDTGKAKLKEKVELGFLDFTVEKVEESAVALGEVTPDEDKKLVVVHVAYTNPGQLAREINWGNYTLAMKDANNEPMDFQNTLFNAVGNTSLNSEIKPGETVRGRLIFSAAKDAKPDSLTFTLSEIRSAIVSLK